MNMNEYGKLVDYVYEYCNRTMIKPNEISQLMEELKLDVLEKYFDTAPGTYVLKRNGSVEKFDQEKLYVSIGCASDAIDEPLTSSDIHNIAVKALKSLEKGRVNIIPTYLIRREVLNAMSDLGFDDVHDKYSVFTGTTSR